MEYCRQVWSIDVHWWEGQNHRWPGKGDPLLIWVVNGYHRANVELDGLILRNTGIQYWQAFNFYWLQILIKMITGILWCIAVRFFMLQIYDKCKRQYIFFNIFIKGKRNKRVIISKVVHNFPQLRARYSLFVLIRNLILDSQRFQSSASLLIL